MTNQQQQPQKRQNDKHSHNNYQWSISDFYFGNEIGTGQFSKCYHCQFKTTYLDVRKHLSSSSNVDKHNNVCIKVIDKIHVTKHHRIKHILQEREILSYFSSLSLSSTASSSDCGTTNNSRDSSSSWVIQLFMSFMDSQNLYLVQELAPFGTLQDFIHDYYYSSNYNDSNTTLTTTASTAETMIRFYASQLLCAIEFLHSHTIIHCDLKPSNVVISYNGRIKIIDFDCGINLCPKKQNNNEGNSQRNTTSTILQPPSFVHEFIGTSDYTSPEVITGKETLLPTTTTTTTYHDEEGVKNTTQHPCAGVDLWSYGCILYFLCTGIAPFHSDSDYMTFQKILSFVSSSCNETIDDCCPDDTNNNNNSSNTTGTKSSIDWPSSINSSTKDIISLFLKNDPHDRLGMKDHVVGMSNAKYVSIRKHYFFQDLDWETFLKMGDDDQNNSRDEIETMIRMPTINSCLHEMYEKSYPENGMIDGDVLPFDYFSG